MSYARNIEAVGCCEPKEMHREITDLPLVELMNGTKDIGFDIVDMAEKINGNLFGRGNISCRESKEDPPMCHREALGQHRATLMQAAEILAKVCAMLGV